MANPAASLRATPTIAAQPEPANSDTTTARWDLPDKGDFPAGWTPVGAGDDAASDFASNSFCIAGYPGYIAGSWAEFSLLFDPASGKERGHLSAEVRLTNSTADADRQLKLLRQFVVPTANTNDCFLKSYTSLIADVAGDGAVLPGARIYAVGDSPATLTGQVIHASVPYRFDGTNKVMYFDEIRIQQERVVAKLLFYTCCEAFDYKIYERRIVDAVIARMTTVAA